MKVRKIPMRSCVITHERLEKKDLVRIVRTPEGNVIVDLSGKANGRGAYLKKNMEVFEKAQKMKALNKHLEVEVPDSIFAELRNLVK